MLGRVGLQIAQHRRGNRITPRLQLGDPALATHHDGGVLVVGLQNRKPRPEVSGGPRQIPVVCGFGVRDGTTPGGPAPNAVDGSPA